MSLQPVLINGSWVTPEDPIDTFQATDPARKETLPEVYPVSRGEDVDLALQAAYEAAAVLRVTAVERIADFLEQFASNIEARAGDLVELAHLETALPKEPRLGTVELPRTTDQLRQAAAAACRSWSVVRGNSTVPKRGSLGRAVSR